MPVGGIDEAARKKHPEYIKLIGVGKSAGPQKKLLANS
jgi:hypothetical protein